MRRRDSTTTRTRSPFVLLLALVLGITSSGHAAGVRLSKVHDDPNGDGELNRAQQLQYTIRIDNQNPADAIVDLTDPVPAGLTFVGVDDSGGGTVVTTTPILQIDGIPVAALGLTQVVFTVVEDGTAAGGDDICNLVTVVCAPDPPVASQPSCIRVADSALTISKAHDDPNGTGELNPGQNLSYTLTISNPLTTATTANVTDPIPAGLTFVSVIDNGGGTVAATTPTLQIDTIPVPASGFVDVVFSVVENGTLPGGQDVCNTATVASPSLPGPVQSAPACITLTESQTVALISKSHHDPNLNGELYRGQLLDYTLRVENNGLTPIIDASVTDTIPVGTDFVSVVDAGGGAVITTTPVLFVDAIPVAAGSFTNVIFRVMENGSQPDGADICNTATLATSVNAGPMDSAPACVVVSDASVPAQITKAHDDPNGNGELNLGQTLRYTLTIVNTGLFDIVDASITDTPPEGVSFLALVDSGGGTVVSTVPTLEISGISVSGAATTDVVFDVVESGVRGDGDIVCNVASLDTAANPGAVLSPPACVTIHAPCDVMTLTSRAQLKGNKLAAGSPAALFEWTDDPNASEFHLNSVTDKLNLVSPGPLQSGGGVVECASSVPQCSDDDALSDPRPLLYYQAISACGANAADEGPI